MTAGLTFYVLMWPVLVGGTMFVIARGFFKEWAQARRAGRMII